MKSSYIWTSRKIIPVDEPQGAYWNQISVTLHPIVVYYHADNQEELAHKSFVVVSDEMSHSASTVLSFLDAIMPEIKALDSEVQMIHYWTDSPSSQYRNKIIFDAVANHDTIYGCKARWNYFEAGHGKGPCDGLGGTAKRMADQAMKSGKVVIQDAAGFMFWAQNSSMKAVKFIYVDSTECQLMSENIKKQEFKPVKGTMKIHAVVGMGNSQIAMHEVSCYCETCIKNNMCEKWKIETTRKPQDLAVEMSEEQIMDITEMPSSTATTSPELEVPQYETGPEQNGIEMHQIHKDNYVAAIYNDDWYVGKVLELDASENDVEISFMEQHKQFYQWPRRADKLWVDIGDILCLVSPPIPTGKSERMFRIDSQDKDTIEKCFGQRLK